MGVDDESTAVVWREVGNGNSYELVEMTKLDSKLKAVEKASVSLKHIILYGKGQL